MSRRLGSAWLVGICGLVLVALAALAAFAAFAALAASVSVSAQQAPRASREDAYRANNLGVAYLEQFNYDAAAKQFRRALEIDGALTMARVNLAIALFYTPDLPAATREAQAVLQQQADEPHAHYLLGLIARSDNRVDEGIAELKRVLEKDSRDVGALVNLGQLLMQRREYGEAVALFRRAAEQEPFHVTATYNLAVALTRAGQTEEGQRMMQRFQTLRESGYGTTFSNAYLEQGRYAEAIVSTGAEPELVDTATPDVAFVPAATIAAAAASAAVPARPAPASAAGAASASGAAATAATAIAAPPAAAAPANAAAPAVPTAAGSVTLADIDGDGDLDLIDVSAGGVRLFRNDRGAFTDVTAQTGISPLAAPAVPLAALAGDYDNDERTDLFILGSGANALYRQTAPWRFENRTATSGVSTGAAVAGTHRAAALVDVDHDGDLDIVLAGHATPNVLLRNNGDGTFVDIAASAKIAEPRLQAVAVAPTDYDNRRDIDLLLVAADRAPVLFRNMRDGTFQDVAQESGLAAATGPGTTGAGAACVAAGDVNKDGFTDLFLGRAAAQGAGVLMLSDGSGRLHPADNAPQIAGALQAQFLDIDNDGLLDLVAISAAGLQAWRNAGRSWVNLADAVKAFNASTDRPVSFAAGDLDGDGATDIAVKMESGKVAILHNRGGSRHPSLRVQLAGRVSNRGGVGSKVEMRAGSLFQKLESSSAAPPIAPADLLFGLGARRKADVVRVLWPSGVLQSEPQEPPPAQQPATSAGAAGAASPAAPTAPAAAAAPAATGAMGAAGHVTVVVRELDRKPSSCPFLYTWNGERFEFITDFMGGGEMGDWQAPGEYNTPDPEEYTRIRGDQLRPRDGRLEVRVTNELEETLFADRFELLAIDHPIDIAVHPHEGLFAPPAPPFALFAARDLGPPARVTDDAGRDVTARARALDRRFIDTFPLERIRGYAKPHDLIIDFGAAAGAAAPADLLLLTGWTDYAFSSDNVAATQAGLVMTPPSLDVLDAHGEWQTVVKEIGIPVGRPQTLVVDLAGKWPAGLANRKRVARIRTNMRIYWDQIQIGSRDARVTPRITRLDPSTADLHWRGFSAEATPDPPYTYDYARVSRVYPWKQMPGRFTREGDVRELLLASDDMFVVSRPGDEIALSFDARALPALPAGWTRTYLLRSDGFSKEMNLHSASPDYAWPLPFHSMTRYPYHAPEAYPLTPERQRYIDRYNTRVVGRPLPRIELGAAPE